MYSKVIFLVIAVLPAVSPRLRGADTLLARTFIHLADSVLATTGDRDVAAKYLDRAAGIWRTADQRLFLETALKAALLFDNTETREEAIRRAEMLDKELDPGSFPSKAALGLFYHKYGTLYHNARQLERALQIYQRALEVRKKAFGDLSMEAALTSFNMGIACRTLGRYQEAIDYLQYSARVRERQGKPLEIGTSWFEIGRLYETKGDFEAAAGAFNRALSFYGQGEKSNDYYLKIGGTWLSLGNVADRTDQPDRAIECYLKAEDFFSQTKEKEEKLTLCYQNLGNIYDNLSDWNNAVSYYHKALNLARKTTQPDRMAFIENNLGFTLTRQGKLKEAEATLERSLSRFRSAYGTRYDAEYAKPLVNLGDIDTARHQYAEALQHYHQALQQVVPVTRRTDWQTDPELTDTTLILGEPYYVLAYLKAKAKGWQLLAFHENKPAFHEHAIAMYRQAVRFQDRILREMIADQSRLVWLGQAREMFESALKSCFAIGDAEAAFYFMEKSRSVLLLDALLANRARNLIPDSLSQKESALKARLADAQNALVFDPTQSDLRQQLLDAQRALNDFLQQLSDAYPQYHNARYNVSVVDLEAARTKLLTAGKSLVIYFYGSEDLYALRLPFSGNAVLASVPVNSDFKSDLDGYLQQFSPANRWNMRPDIFGRTAAALFNHIYRPVFSPDDRQVIIVPDGELGFVPFDALLVTEPDGGGWKTLDYLARQQVLQQAFSASVLAGQRQLLHPNGANYLLAPGFAGGEQGQAPLLMDGFHAQENRSMQVYTGNEARRSLLTGWSNGGGILHFFTHAEAGDHPRIYFIDSLLQLPELYASSLPFDLVILSACETNIGQVARGEGVMSLSRGFAYAGAASLMASLWQVKPQASAGILNQFYQLLNDRIPRAEALQQAKLAYLESAPEMRAMPSYWAGMVMNGKDGEVDLGTRGGLLPWALGLLLVALLAAVFFFIKNRRTAPLLWIGMAATGIAGCRSDSPQWKLTWAEQNSPAMEGSVFPYPFQQEGGALWQTWLYEPDTLSRLMVASRRDGNWSSPIQITADADWFINWADFPAIYARNDSFLATYVLAMHARGAYAYDIGVYCSKDAGLTWTGPLIPHTDGTPTEHGFVAMTDWPGDRIGMVWLDGRNFAVQSGTPEGGEADMTLRFAAIDREGRLSDEAELDNRTCSCCQTDAATLGDGSVVVVYRDRSMTEVRDIALVKWQDGVWSEPRLVHADNWTIAGCPVNGPAVSAKGNRVVVAWFTAAEGRARVNLAWSDDGGESFGAPLALDKGNPEGRVDVRLLDDGHALVSWIEKENEGKAGIRLAVVDPLGTLLADERIADINIERSSGFPRMAAGNGKFYLTWTQTGELPRIRMVEGWMEGI